MTEGSLIKYPIHPARKAFKISGIASIKNLSLSTEFALKCNASGKHGTWEVTLKLSKDPLFKNFKISADLKRIDSEKTHLSAFLHIMLENIQGKLCPLSYSMNGVFGAQESESKMFEVDEHFRCLFVNESLPQDTLVFEIKLVVAGCHGRHAGCDVGVAAININDGTIETGDCAMFASL